MAEPCCCACDCPFDEGEFPVDEYDPLLGVHFLVHDYCQRQREVDEARAEEEAREAAYERHVDHGVDVALERERFGEDA